MKLKYEEISSIFCCGCESWSVAVREGIRLCVFSSRVLGKIFCCGCEFWSVAVREGNRLCVFSSRVLGKIFGLDREEVTRNWGKVQSVQVHNL
jgi:hypothetical protein